MSNVNKARVMKRVQELISGMPHAELPPKQITDEALRLWDVTEMVSETA